MIHYDLFFYSKKICYYQLNKDNTKKQKIQNTETNTEILMEKTIGQYKNLSEE